MSVRSDIKANLVTAYKTISKVREVSTKFRLIEQVNKSSMPYIQVMPTVDNRERADSSKNTDCRWEIAIWCYVQDEDDIETWVENIRDKTNDDRTRGNNARDCYIEKFVTDNVLVGSITRGLIIAMIIVEYRVKD